MVYKAQRTAPTLYKYEYQRMKYLVKNLWNFPFKQKNNLENKNKNKLREKD